MNLEKDKHKDVCFFPEDLKMFRQLSYEANDMIYLVVLWHSVMLFITLEPLINMTYVSPLYLVCTSDLGWVANQGKKTLMMQQTRNKFHFCLLLFPLIVDEILVSFIHNCKYSNYFPNSCPFEKWLFFFL